MNQTLTLDGLKVVRGGRLVVTDVGAELPSGVVTALVGPNGAGKSSLLGAIAGTLPAGGRVRYDGGLLAREAIAYMPQAAVVRATLTVFEVVLLGRLERLGWHVHDADVAAAADALELLELAPLADRRIGTLSGGQQQLVLLAQKIARRPRVLLLDEPTSALDLKRQLLVLELLTRYASSTGAVVIAALHDLSLASRYAAELLLLYDGRLIAHGPPINVLRPDTIRAAYEVEARVVEIEPGVPVVIPVRGTSASTTCDDGSMFCLN